MTTFYLVRHAHAEWTPDENRPLSPRGRRDALHVADLLCAEAQDAPIAALYASTARRAQQTVAPLAERLGLPLHVVPALDERRLAGGPVADFGAAVRATWADFNFRHAGGETNAEARARGLDLVRSLARGQPKARIVLGTHGNLLALIVNGFWPCCGYDFWQALTMPDLYRLDLDTSNDNTQPSGLTRLWPPNEHVPERRQS
jgi:2,3-bisphosphoglycerate-dependent phosphoglycerate mutase